MNGPAKRNRTAALIALSMSGGMLALSFAAVPLYRAFCQVTGFDGTTQRAEQAADRVVARKITVRFDSTTDPGLPWLFKPMQVDQTIHIGETGLAYFEAKNLTDRPITGKASYNVSPAKMGVYFKKIQCFCFDEQTLAPGEDVKMPVTYFIDPKIVDDPDLDDVQTVTLAYTFFPWDDPDADAAKAKGSK
ncbi:MAG: cytochrome c oxidase assembly protein [Parvularculaceae bacterium]